MDKIKKRWAECLVGLLVVLAAAAWWLLHPLDLPGSFTSSDGRTKATGVDIASKIAGCIDTILVKEDRFVCQGKVLAETNTRVLNEQCLEAVTQIEEAGSAVLAVGASLDQRRGKVCASEAVVKQRQTELDSLAERHVRPNVLPQRGAVSAQQLDDDRAAVESAHTALESAEVQVSAARTAVEAAYTSIIQARTHIGTAQVTERRVSADIDDSELKAPHDGYTQYRVAEPGKVLTVGDRALNMVDLVDAYVTFLLPAEQTDLLILGNEARLILDAVPDLMTPVNISSVTSVAQLTPKTVETSDERFKLMSRVRARIPPELLVQYLEYIETGLPGMAYIRVDK